MTDTYKPRVWKHASDEVVEKPKDLPREAEYVAPYYKIGAVASAAGSVYYEFGNTKVVCSVYGPKPSSQNQFHQNGIVSCDVKFAPFALEARRKTQLKNEPSDLHLASSLQEALAATVQLDKFPNHEVQVFVEVLETGGNEVAAAICAASLALVDSGVELYDVVSASIVAYISDIGVVVNPTVDHFSQPKYRGSLTVSYMPALNQITFLQQTGRLLPNHLKLLLDKALEECNTTAVDMKQVILQHYQE